VNPTLWQLNPALSIEFHKRERTLRIGLMSPNCYEISDRSEALLRLISYLKNEGCVEKEKLLNQIALLFDHEPGDIFHDLLALKLLIPVIDLDSRYARHELYYGFSGAPTNIQKLLAERSVFLIGVGGIGSACAMLLGAAGIGELILADQDELELSNLTRATLFELSDLGKPKVEAAAKRLALRNPKVRVRTISYSLNAETLALFEGAAEAADMMVLSGDSGAEVHRLTYFLSKKYNKPLLNAGYVEHCGVIGPLTVGANAKRESELADESTDTVQVNPGYKAASFGPLNSLVASIAANEVIRYFAGQDLQTLNRRLVIDSYQYTQKWESFA